MPIRHATSPDASFSPAGAAAWIADHTGGRGLLFADAPNTNFDVSAGTATTILTKSITGITLSPRTKISVEMWYSFLQNSGAPRAYTATISLGSLQILNAGAFTTVVNSATSRTIHHLTIDFAISAANLAFGSLWFEAAFAAAQTGVSGASTGVCGAWNSGTSDLSGTQTFLFQLTAPAAATQTVTLQDYVITMDTQL